MKKSANMLKHMTPKPKMTATVRDNAMKAVPKTHHGGNLGKWLHPAKKK